MPVVKTHMQIRNPSARFSSAGGAADLVPSIPLEILQLVIAVFRRRDIEIRLRC
jgi:hypothetical protein